jgi:hypothetical protein
MLSMLSSLRGQRGGYTGVLGIAGLNVEVEGTRTWRAREAAVGLVGEAGREFEGMRASLRGLGVGAAESPWIRDLKRVHVSTHSPTRIKETTYGPWRLLDVSAGGGGIRWGRR